MSCTTVYALFRSKVVGIAEHRNSWGSAPLVWGLLESKYLIKGQFSRMITGQMQEIWDLAKSDRLTEAEKFALHATFDYSFCEVSQLNRGADLLDEFSVEAAKAEPNKVNHWAAIAQDYRLAAKSPDHRMRGVCIGCTSVSDPWEWNETFGRNAPDHWGIFSDLDKLKAA